MRNNLKEKDPIELHSIANEIAELLDDVKSIRYYEILINENDPDELLETARYVAGVDKEGGIRTNKAIYFQGVLRRTGYKTKFKKTY